MVGLLLEGVIVQQICQRDDIVIPIRCRLAERAIFDSATEPGTVLDKAVVVVDGSSQA